MSGVMVLFVFSRTNGLNSSKLMYRDVQMQMFSLSYCCKRVSVDPSRSELADWVTANLLLHSSLMGDLAESD